MLRPAVQRSLIRWTICGMYPPITKAVPTKPQIWEVVIRFLPAASGPHAINAVAFVKISPRRVVEQTLIIRLLDADLEVDAFPSAIARPIRRKVHTRPETQLPRLEVHRMNT